MFMPKEITIKQVMDREGHFSHLELWQDENCIKLSLASAGMDSHSHNGKWANLKLQIDRMIKENPYSPEQYEKKATQDNFVPTPRYNFKGEPILEKPKK